MKKQIFLIVMLSTVSFLLQAQPKFTIIGGDEYNWGEVRPDQSPLKCKVQFKNEGNENLVIINVKPNCGCTAAKPDKDTLKPGETTDMDISLNVASATGATQKTIMIETNDPDRKKMWYKLSCNVIRDIIVKPTQHFAFRSVEVSKTATETIYLKNNSDKPIHFSDMKLEPETPPVVLTIPKDFTIKPGEEIPVTASITTTDAGYFNVKLTFKTDHPDYKEFSIPIYGDAKASAMLNNNKK